MRVLVTGGAGFIGSHLCEALLERGYWLRVLDNLSLGRREWIPKHDQLEFIEGDIRDPEVCRQAVGGTEGVFHLAAMSKVAPSLSSSAMVQYCLDHNVSGTVNILEAAKEAKVGKVVYSASSTVYGNNPVPHKETALPDCRTPYALSKYMGEQCCLLYDSLFDLPVISLRLFQVYGPRQPAAGEYAVVAGIFLEQAREGKPLTIHGDGSQKRDFVHVFDVVEAFIRAFESRLRGVVLNVGTGSSFSVKQLADLISENQQSGLPRRAADLEETKADTEELETALDWKPSIDFDGSIRKMCEGMSTKPKTEEID